MMLKNAFYIYYDTHTWRKKNCREKRENIKYIDRYDLEDVYNYRKKREKSQKNKNKQTLISTKDKLFRMDI